jgi:hypothetical protein
VTDLRSSRSCTALLQANRSVPSTAFMISTLGGGPLAPMGRWADEKWRFGQENLMVQRYVKNKPDPVENQVLRKNTVAF